jgi:hypothetical protein
MKTFSQSLLEFARAVDIVDERARERVLRMITDYAREALRAPSWGLYLRQLVKLDGELVPGLAVVQGSGRYHWSLPLFVEGRPSAHVALACIAKRPLWITTRNQEPLQGGSSVDFIDQLSGVKDIPPYSAVEHQPIRTSIYLPLLSRSPTGTGPLDDAIGVLNLEAAQYAGCSPALRDEVRFISEALSLVWGKADATAISLATTETALDTLKTDLDSSLRLLKRQPLLGKPELFLGMSERAPKEVQRVILDCLAAFKREGLVDAYFWAEDSRTGNRNVQLWEQLERCTLGIFYLSEPHPSSGELERQGDRPVRFVDNLNVVFEMGAFRAVHWTDPARSPVIIVRESVSGPAPFDFAPEDRIDVERDGEWETRLTELLGTRLRLLLAIDVKSPLLHGRGDA